MTLLKDKIVVVTGGSGLLGRAIVEEIHRQGGTPINADISAKDDLKKGEHSLDIGQEDSITTLRDAVVAQYGRIDGWVNAAYPRTDDFRVSFEEMPAESWRKNVDLHLNGYALCCKAALAQMRKQKSGSLVNLASIYGVVAPDYKIYEGMEDMANPIVYGAIKGGIVQMSKHLAALYGPHGVRVNTLSPGGIFDSHDKKFVERYSAKTMLGRMGTPDDVAKPVVFLLSDSAKYITGHNLMVDGGFSVM